MIHGPLDFIMIGFDDSDIGPDVADGILSLIQSGTIRVIDLIFVAKNSEGDLRVVELHELPDNVYDSWDAVVDELEGMLTVEDAMHLAADLPANRSAVLALYENTWARELAGAIQAANGEVLATLRIPRGVVAELEGMV